jgi:hypothetical protein
LCLLRPCTRTPVLAPTPRHYIDGGACTASNRFRNRSSRSSGHANSLSSVAAAG